MEPLVITTRPEKTLVCLTSSCRSASASMFMGLLRSAFSALRRAKGAGQGCKHKEVMRCFMEGTNLAIIVATHCRPG